VIEWLQGLSESVTSHGIIAFVLLYLVIASLPLPRWPLTVAAGAAFGFVKGVVISLVVAFLGASVAFLASRYLFRRSLQKWCERKPKLKAIDQAMRDGGWRAVALLQMSPAVPFGLQNYFLGASRVKLRQYLIGTAITGLPSTLIYVGIGAGSRFVTGLDNGMKWVGLAVGLAVTVALSVWINRMAKKKLAQAEGSRGPVAAPAE
jgi:uncharacterized membrane protein YdjX (TVP38/TMEM64 family)